MAGKINLWGKQVLEIVDRALAEDIGWGDATSDSLLSPDISGKAHFLAKAEGVLAGIEVARMAFHRVDQKVQFEALLPDGSSIHPGDIIARVNGRVLSILKSERVALNFLQHLSGIASETARYVAAVKGHNVRIIDTRKTIPGLRILEKYAVRIGGGINHRQHLGDGILIKDNHLQALKSQGMSLREIIHQAKFSNRAFNLRIEVEVNNFDDALEAAEAGAEIIMLDNMSLAEMRRAVSQLKGKVWLEASGGITLEKVSQVAETGVDFISIGALTHSAQALDISLEIGG
jgi:nicotinate-nucleotide pyrophosphorylase (carboxylating)